VNTFKEIEAHLDYCLATFGAYTLHDKGPAEVMDVELIDRLFRAQTVNEAISTLDRLRTRDNSEPLVEYLEARYIENEEWPELAARFPTPIIDEFSTRAPHQGEPAESLKDFLSRIGPERAHTSDFNPTPQYQVTFQVVVMANSADEATEEARQLIQNRHFEALNVTLLEDQ
jgi:hypothetical protein